MISARAARIGALVFCVLAGLAESRAAEPGSLKFPDALLEPAAWSQLDGWTGDDHAAAYVTFLTSCRAIQSQTKPAPAARRFVEAMKAVCGRARAALPLGEEEARAFFETNFQPLHIARVGDPAGFLTGYYEPIVAGSRFPTPEFTVPMYRRPGDLIMAGGKRKKGVFSNKGKVYRKVGRKSVLYYTRAEIEDGALDGRHLEICWLKDPIDAFFIHIQGSARIRLEDGTMLRINYDAHNGHRYLPVGRVLIERGEVTKEEMSMERIRQWMLVRPEEGRALRRMNNSFVFFRVTGLADHQEPVGAQGVSLTPVRSIAVDRHLHLYGTVFWIEAELPIASEVPETKFRRLMVAQDTGSAIVGPARADIYFGAGDEAGLIGGRIKQPGRFVMLVPREVDPFAKWRNVPMPPIRAEAAVAAEPAPTPAAATAPSPQPQAAPSPETKAAAPEPGPQPKAVPKPKTKAAATEPSPAPKVAPRPKAKAAATKPSPEPKAAPKPKAKAAAHPKKTVARGAAEPSPTFSGLAKLFGRPSPETKPAGTGSTKPKARGNAPKPKQKPLTSARKQ